MRLLSTQNRDTARINVASFTSHPISAIPSLLFCAVLHPTQPEVKFGDFNASRAREEKLIRNFIFDFHTRTILTLKNFMPYHTLKERGKENLSQKATIGTRPFGNG